MKKCSVCDRIKKIKCGSNSCFVKELETGYVVLEDYQFYQGYVIFICKKCTNELHHLEADFREKFLSEMSIVAEAVYKTFKPFKLNYEMLGNMNPHAHWHIIPRYLNDLQLHKPIWMLDEKIRRAKNEKPSEKSLNKIKNQLKEELDKIYTK